MRALSVFGLAASALFARCEASGELRPSAKVTPTALALPAADHQLSLRADRRWVLAEVQLGERKVIAAFDTGLSVSALIDEKLCEELELPVRRGLWSRDGGGGSGYKRGAVLPELQWGTFGARGVRALRGDLSFLRTDQGEPIELILGCRLFRGWMQQIDLPQGELRLIRGELPPVGEHPHVVSVRRGSGVPFCAFRVENRTLRLLLDSGYDGGLALPDSLRSELPLRGEARRTGRVRTLLEAGGAIHTARLAGSLSFAGYQLETPAVQFLEGYEHAVLGRQALDAWVWTLDFRRGRAHFQVIAKPEARGLAGILMDPLLPRTSPVAAEAK